MQLLRSSRAGRGGIEPLERRVLLSAVVKVTTTADSMMPPTGSLRAAILAANASTTTDTIIEFDLKGRGVRTIKPVAALPAITAHVDIQGLTDSSGNPLIELNGSNAGANVNGLLFNRASSGDSKPSQVSGLVINHFSKNGIDIEGSEPTNVFGCRIGTDPTGKTAEGNGNDGILVNVPGCQIGLAGKGAAFQTVISGNANNGIEIASSGSDTIVQNCFIGTDVTGNSAVGNSDDGIVIAAPFSTIGGRRAHQGNLISGNQNIGLAITSGNSDVLGNLIGTNQAGTAAIPNATNGIFTDNVVNVSIGDSTDAGRNLISGNRDGGIAIDNSQNTQIDDNFIGTEITGTKALGNATEGVSIVNSTNDGMTQDVVGGTTTAASSGGWGILLQQSSNISITQCDIGIDRSKKHAIPNVVEGIVIFKATGSQIFNNVVADNAAAGIAITDNSSIGNRISENSIFSNGNLGINLGNDANMPLPNHSGTIAGPNDDQNHPILSSAVVSGGHTAINGTLNSTPNSFFSIEFFSSPSDDPSGFGEGQTFLGSVRAQTDGNGNASFSASVNPSGFGQFISATAIATPSGPSDGDTSEFSADMPVAGASITGEVFDDSNGNGAVSLGEGGLKGRTVYIDTHNDGLFDRNVDPYAVTDSHGDFRIFGVAPGTYHLRLLGTAGWQQSAPAPKSAAQTVVVTGLNTTSGVLFGQEKSTAKVAALAIDAGSNSPYVDLTGQTFAADTQHPLEFVGFPVAGTDDDPLYYSLVDIKNFNYSFSVPNGKYVLKLYFTDPTSTAAGQRTFNITANGTLILKKFDIFKTAGATKKAVVTSSNLTIGNKSLALNFSGVTGDAIVSAIELIPA